MFRNGVKTAVSAARGGATAGSAPLLGRGRAIIGLILASVVVWFPCRREPLAPPLLPTDSITQERVARLRGRDV